ncbi:MAG TPA: Hsp70 family protein [Coriobacteriaceae bacterium]|nr:Hsp70 family protein [Coriobacteriaceae bacterium]
MASSVFGIDLGTTYSCIAYIDENGNVQVAKNRDTGKTTTPSVVEFEDAGNVIVGEDAKSDAIFNPEKVVTFVKRLMGRTDQATFINGEKKSPEEVSSYILRKLAQDASVDTGLEVKDVVITVPAYFGDSERNATRAAGEIAGLNVLQIIQEPVAAAVYYGTTKAKEDSVVLVYDLGGGTFDVNVIEIKTSDNGNTLAVKWTDGDDTLGGKDWDAAIVDYLQEKYREETGFEDEFEEEAEEEFQSQAEAAKQALTQKNSYNVRLRMTETPFKCELTRDEFERITEHLLQRTIDTTQRCINEAAKIGANVGKILLVGGSTRMPQVENALREIYPDIPIELADPDEAVARGAALCALDAASTVIDSEANNPTAVSGMEKKEIAEDNIVRKLQLGGTQNVIAYATSKSYGLKTLQGISNLIKKNQPIPTDTHVFVAEDTFATAFEGQPNVELEIFESDTTDDIYQTDAEPIKRQTFDLGGPKPQGYAIRVTFSLNEEGLLSITAVDAQTGTTCDFDVQVTTGLDAGSIEEVKRNALLASID